MKKPKYKVLYKGESQKEIRAGEFQGVFEPNQEYAIEDIRFFNYLLEEEEGFEFIPAHTLAGLLELKKEKLIEMADKLGVEDAASLNKEPLAKAIIEKEALQNG